MRIGIDTHPLLSTVTGIGRYTQQLIKDLKNIKKASDELIYFWGAEYGITEYMIDNIDENIHKKRFSITKQSFWEQFILPYKIYDNDIDVFHSPRNYNIPYLNLNSCPLIVTMHDIIPLLFPKHFNISIRARFYLTAKNADHIITISENSKKDIIEYFGLNEDKVTVIPNVVNEKFYLKNIDQSLLNEVKDKYNIKRKYLLTTGGMEQVKNIKLLFEVMKRGKNKDPEIFKNLELVITSPKWLEKEIPKNISDNINFTGYIPEQDFPVLMSGAELFLFPSLYEGFGLPPLEAMAAETMVITSNASSIPEVVGEAGIMLDPNSSEPWIDTISSVLRDPNYKNKYISKGKENVEKFSRAKTAEEIYRNYEEEIWKKNNS